MSRRTLAEVAMVLAQLPLRSLILDLTSLSNDGRYRRVNGRCAVCDEVRSYYVDGFLKGLTRGCPCTNPRRLKYDDPRASMLGDRYRAMKQRCSDPRQKSYKNYGGRGIQVQFDSCEHFVKWALAKWPDTDFTDLEFDRKDNDGHYHPDNLRLVTTKVNAQNRRPRAAT